jgi:hypothetical protein
MFQPGAMYTRREIQDTIGGGVQSYLPSLDGNVVAACLRPDTNPDAPKVILAGQGVQIERRAQRLVDRRVAVPTFIKRDTNRWEYVGDYVPVSISKAPGDIAAYTAGTDRRDVSAVVHMAKAGAHS